jgi:phosphoribosylanthranilate isomerase
MWIKICGNTNLEDARFAAEAGADAVGFVFAPSPRQVKVDLVRRITRELPPQVEKYGVFVDADFDQIVSTVTGCGLTGVQIHRSSNALLPFQLRKHFAQFPGHIDIVLALHYQEPGLEFEHHLGELSGSDGTLDAVLVDSSTPRAVGGTGTSFNWAGARSSFLRAAPHLRLIAGSGA